MKFLKRFLARSGSSDQAYLEEIHHSSLDEKRREGVPAQERISRDDANERDSDLNLLGNPTESMDLGETLSDAPPATGLDAPPATGLDAPPATGLDAPPATGLDAPPATGLLERCSIQNPNQVNGTIVIGDGGTYRISGKPSLMIDSVPDIELDWGSIDGIEVRAASIRGRTHRYEGSVRQDSFNIARISGESESYLFLCVADGLGSYPKSHIAAREADCAAARNFSEQLRHTGSLEGVDVNAIIGRIQSDILDAWRQRERNPDLSMQDLCDQMRTTLSIALIPNVPSEDGAFRIKIFTVGDTSAWVLQKESGWKPITPVKGAGADIFSSSVSAIPSTAPVKFDEREYALHRGDAFFLMTDGIGDPLGDGSGPVGEALASMLRNAPDIYDFARICDFARRTHMDDRTLLGIWMPPE
jgi:hypothetical protein